MPIFVTFSDKLNFIRKTLPTRKSQASYDKMTNGAATIHVVKESKITPTTPTIYSTWVVEFYVCNMGYIEIATACIPCY